MYLKQGDASQNDWVQDINYWKTTPTVDVPVDDFLSSDGHEDKKSTAGDRRENLYGLQLMSCGVPSRQ